MTHIHAPRPPRRIVLLTGMAGAGLSTARTAFEDIGFQAIDNLPLDMIDPLLQKSTRPSLALGIDVRTEGFNAQKVIDLLDRLNQTPDTQARLVFLECEDSQLMGRFSETRRHHPLAGEERPVKDGLAIERQLLAPLKARSNLMLDTTAISTTDLRALLHGHFPRDVGSGMTVQVMSFSYRHGTPREADFVFDARGLRSPHYDPMLKAKTGQDEGVGEYIMEDPNFKPIWTGLTLMLGASIAGFKNNNRPYVTIAFGCTGGKHRSVFLTECMAQHLKHQGFAVQINHRELIKNKMAKPVATIAMPKDY